MMNWFFRILAFASAFGSGIAVALIDDAQIPSEQVEFFEKSVRPVLIERCFECHSSDAEEVKAGLLVESRKALLAGGESGPAIVPGEPEKSLLIASIRYESFEMPPKGKLRPEEIASLVKWVQMGAPWPSDTSAIEHVAMAAEQPRDWDALRQDHWAFNPIQKMVPPDVRNTTWPESDIDRFILSRLEDGDNRLLWRMNPRRLDVEAWRDALLAVAGDLDLQLGGLPVDDLNSARRTIYMQVSRNGDHFRADEFMRLFDFPAMRATVSERLPNTVPQQYLFMMNNEYMLRRAELFASRLEKESPTVEQRIERAYRLLYSRLPTVEEQQARLEFLIAGTATVRGVADDDKSRMARYLQVLLSSNEFMYLE